jgi:phage terminase small subunit
MQRRFVLEFVINGGTAAQAAMRAGYSAHKSTLHPMASKLLHDEKVQAALHEEGVKRLRTTSIMAIGVLDKIIRNPKSADRDKIAAAREVFSRGGFNAITEHQHTVTHRSEAEVDAELSALAAELGLDVMKLLGRQKRAKVIDVTPEPVEEPEEWETISTERAPCAVCGVVHPSHLPDCFGDAMEKESGIATAEDPTATGEPDEAPDISDLF